MSKFSPFAILGGKSMANFYEQKLGSYLVKLRPNDPLRWKIADIGNPTPYFNATEITFDVRVSLPKGTKKVKDTIKQI